MADNFLERHREDYEQRKAAWLRRKKHLPKIKKPAIKRPDDEALQKGVYNQGDISDCLLSMREW